MPIYTYRCENCGLQFDQKQSFSEDSLTRCPECNHKSLKKVFQPVGIVFKGSGFYSTDNHSPSGASPKKDERDEEKKDSSGKDKEKKEDTGAKDKEKKDDTGTKNKEKKDSSRDSQEKTKPDTSVSESTPKD